MEPCRKVYSHKEVVPRTAAQAAQDQQPTSLFWTLLGDMPPFRLPAPPVVAAPRPYKMPDLEDIIVDDPLDDLPLILPEPPLRVPEVPIRDETDDYDIIDPSTHKFNYEHRSSLGLRREIFKSNQNSEVFVF